MLAVVDSHINQNLDLNRSNQIGPKYIITGQLNLKSFVLASKLYK